MEKKSIGGNKVFVPAPKTSINWFKKGAQQSNANNGISTMSAGFKKSQSDNPAKYSEAYVPTDEQIANDQKVDQDTDVKLEFSRSHTRFVRFDAKYSDNDLVINDDISMLVSPQPEPSNILMFELVLLASDVVPKDYVVGWGVFPLMDSEFKINEGKFKLPLLFGNVNVKFDKFGKIEQCYKDDLDNWLCNLYFELEAIKLSDVKIINKSVDSDGFAKSASTFELYYAPLSRKGVASNQKDAQELKQDQDQERD